MSVMLPVNMKMPRSRANAEWERNNLHKTSRQRGHRKSNVRRHFMRCSATLILLNVTLARNAIAQQGDASSDTFRELSKRVQNPIASLIRVPFQNKTNFTMGPYRRVQNVLNIGPDSEAARRVDAFLRYFVNYGLPRGWHVGSSPIITTDWAATGE